MFLYKAQGIFIFTHSQTQPPYTFSPKNAAASITQTLHYLYVCKESHQLHVLQL